jgi:oxalate decarboxylase
MANSSYLFHLSRPDPQPLPHGIRRRRVDASGLPALQGLAAELLALGPHGSHGPVWQANAHILACCLAGEARIAISSPGPIHDCFTVAPSDLFFIQQGFLHRFESLAGTKLLLIFSHERPIELGPDGLAQGAAGPPRAPKAARAGPANPHRISLAMVAPVAGASGDLARIVSAEEFSILDKLSFRAQLLRRDGAHGLHWHPNCAEIGYVARGRARLSVLRPGNRIDRIDIGAGDVYFVPVAHLHGIENISPGETELLIGFSHEMPQDIMLDAALTE